MVLTSLRGSSAYKNSFLSQGKESAPIPIPANPPSSEAIGLGMETQYTGAIRSSVPRYLKKKSVPCEGDVDSWVGEVSNTSRPPPLLPVLNVVYKTIKKRLHYEDFKYIKTTYINY